MIPKKDQQFGLRECEKNLWLRLRKTFTLNPAEPSKTQIGKKEEKKKTPGHMKNPPDAKGFDSAVKQPQ